MQELLYLARWSNRFAQIAQGPIRSSFRPVCPIAGGSLRGRQTSCLGRLDRLNQRSRGRPAMEKVRRRRSFAAFGGAWAYKQSPSCAVREVSPDQSIGISPMRRDPDGIVTASRGSWVPAMRDHCTDSVQVVTFSALLPRTFVAAQCPIALRENKSELQVGDVTNG